jgi:hypothetical protein
MIENMVVCEAQYVDAGSLDSVDTEMVLAKYRSRLHNGSRRFDERTFKVRDYKVRCLEMWQKIVEQALRVPITKEGGIPPDWADVAANDHSRHAMTQI